MSYIQVHSTEDLIAKFQGYISRLGFIPLDVIYRTDNYLILLDSSDNSIKATFTPERCKLPNFEYDYESTIKLQYLFDAIEYCEN